jgi:hypothetical protein
VNKDLECSVFEFLNRCTTSQREFVENLLVDKEFVQRANTVLLLGILWAGLAVCVIGALAYDIAYWLQNW